MTAVILTIHVLIVLGLIVVVLLQRSDGGALGIGGGGGGGFMSGRSAANALTRTTSILAAIFFGTSLGLAVMAGTGERAETVIEELTGEAAPDLNAPPAPTTNEDLLNALSSGDEAEDTVANPELVVTPAAEEPSAEPAATEADEEEPGENEEETP